MKKVIVKKLTPAFTDKRGLILDILEEKIHHLGYITFTKNAVRAAHYHKKSTQYTYVLSGVIELTVKGLAANARKKKIRMTPGTLASIPPRIIHVYRALTPAVILDMTTEHRRAGNYEKDTIRVKEI